MFWELYGLNYFDVMRLPFVQYEGMARAIERFKRRRDREARKQRKNGGV